MQVLTPMRQIRTTPVVVGSGAYAAGDQVGAGLYQLPGLCPRGFLAGLVALGYIVKTSAANVAVTLIFYSDTFTVTTADNDVWAPSDANSVAYLQCLASLSTSAIVLGANSVLTTTSGARVVESLNASGDVYMAIVAAGAFTLAATDDLTILTTWQQFEKF